MKITPWFSACPNNTYIFDALIHQKVDIEDIAFDVVSGDDWRLKLFTVNLEETGTNAVKALHDKTADFEITEIAGHDFFVE